MRCLLLSSFLLGIASCGVPKDSMLVEVQKDCPVLAKHLVGTATYNTQIDFWGKHLSGLLVFKTISDTVERTVFITETGFKFFDFEFTPSGFAVKYCLSGLNKKIVINTLHRDLGYLAGFNNSKVAWANKALSDDVTYQCKTGKNGFDYYTVDSGRTSIKKMEHGNKMHKSLVIDFDGMKSDNFDTIKIIDRRAHLNIFMKQIDK